MLIGNYTGNNGSAFYLKQLDSQAPISIGLSFADIGFAGEFYLNTLTQWNSLNKEEFKVFMEKLVSFDEEFFSPIQQHFLKAEFEEDTKFCHHKAQAYYLTYDLGVFRGKMNLMMKTQRQSSRRKNETEEEVCFAFTVKSVSQLGVVFLEQKRIRLDYERNIFQVEMEQEEANQKPGQQINKKKAMLFVLLANLTLISLFFLVFRNKLK